ncbi:MAG TPA: succinylglutamate desuccinylase, partial [Spirochaetia bacterium]|nr:succinylglutamate desuccinylase [Spirochaetia bacterium]
LRGLSHRELGDATDTLAVLFESCNPSQGRLRGRTDEALVVEGKDPYYLRAAALGRLYVPFDEGGVPLAERVGRHLASIAELAFSMGMESEDEGLELSGVPGYDEISELGVGAFLSPAPEAGS